MVGLCPAVHWQLTQPTGGNVFKKYALAAAIAAAASSVSIAAQTTPAPQSGTQATTVLTGCVYNEKDVPGRAPNVAERAGIAED
jgi:hypothetical protein